MNNQDVTPTSTASTVLTTVTTNPRNLIATDSVLVLHPTLAHLADSTINPSQSLVNWLAHKDLPEPTQYHSVYQSSDGKLTLTDQSATPVGFIYANHTNDLQPDLDVINSYSTNDLVCADVCDDKGWMLVSDYTVPNLPLPELKSYLVAKYPDYSDAFEHILDNRDVG